MCHLRSVIYSVELVLLNKHQILGGAPKLDCYREVKWQTVPDAWTGCRKTPYHRQWSVELVVRSVQTLMMITFVALNWHWLHVKVHDRDTLAPGYADSGRWGSTVCTWHDVVLVTSASHEEVIYRPQTFVSRRLDMLQWSRRIATCRTCGLVNWLT